MDTEFSPLLSFGFVFSEGAEVVLDVEEISSSLSDSESSAILIMYPKNTKINQDFL